MNTQEEKQETISINIMDKPTECDTNIESTSSQKEVSIRRKYPLTRFGGHLIGYIESTLYPPHVMKSYIDQVQLFNEQL